MAHHKVNIILGQVIKGNAFGDDTSNHLVSHFAASLLIGALRIAEEDPGTKLSGTPVALNGSGIPDDLKPHREKQLSLPVKSDTDLAFCLCKIVKNIDLLCSFCYNSKKS